MKRYEDCIREDGECTMCSLSSYGRDCHGKNTSKIAWMRHASGLTQTALAKKIGVTFRWVQKLESGEVQVENITLKNAIALADALGVEVRELL